MEEEEKVLVGCGVEWGWGCCSSFIYLGPILEHVVFLGDNERLLLITVGGR